MKFLTILIFCFTINTAVAADPKIYQHVKLVKAITNIQSCHWILDDLVSSNAIYCKTQDAQKIFNAAYSNVSILAKKLKDHLALGPEVDLSHIYTISKTANNNFNTFKTLIFFNEIMTKSKIAEYKFEQSRFHLMKSIIHLREFVENGDDDIFDPLNQRNSAITALKTRVPKEWDKLLLQSLPHFLSQTDLHFVYTLIDKTSPGSISRHIKSYLKNHLDFAKEGNFKGHLASILIGSASGWTLESLEVLPAFISKDSYKQSIELISKISRHQIPLKLKDFFDQL